MRNKFWKNFSLEFSVAFFLVFLLLVSIKFVVAAPERVTQEEGQSSVDPLPLPAGLGATHKRNLQPIVAVQSTYCSTESVYFKGSCVPAGAEEFYGKTFFGGLIFELVNLIDFVLGGLVLVFIIFKLFYIFLSSGDEIKIKKRKQIAEYAFKIMIFGLVFAYLISAIERISTSSYGLSLHLSLTSIIALISAEYFGKLMLISLICTAVFGCCYFFLNKGNVKAQIIKREIFTMLYTFLISFAAAIILIFIYIYCPNLFF